MHPKLIDRRMGILYSRLKNIKESGTHTLKEEKTMSNVVSLEDRKRQRDEEKSTTPMDEQIIANYFEEIEEKNKQIAARRRDERTKNNKKTLRDYKIKS